jgi:uncharacterized protein involved in exopolysaccharide biosynthesis
MEPDTARRENEIELTELLRALYRRWRLIFKVTAAAAVVSAVVSLLLPIYYKAETRILPPQDQGNNLAAQLMSQAGGMITLAGGDVGLKSRGELFIGMLQSRTVLDRMVDRFDLKKLYNAKFREDARNALIGLLEAREDRKSGIITLTVEDKDPKRSADMANAFIEELRSLAGGLAITEAAERRLFFEEQIRHARESLSRAEEDLKEFQQKTGAFHIDAQAQANIQGIANLRANISAKEVEARMLRSYSTSRNPDLQRVEEELRALRTELAKMETPQGKGFDPIMSAGRVPEIGVEYLRKLRQLKYNETLYELLVKQYELARLEEARDSAVIQVIDRAVAPETRSRPRRTLIVILATAAGFFLSCLIALILERPGKKSELRP